MKSEEAGHFMRLLVVVRRVWYGSNSELYCTCVISMRSSGICQDSQNESSTLDVHVMLGQWWATAKCRGLFGNKKRPLTPWSFLSMRDPANSRART